MQLAPSPLGAKKEFSGSGRYPNPNPNPNPNSNPLALALALALALTLTLTLILTRFNGAPSSPLREAEEGHDLTNEFRLTKRVLRPSESAYTFGTCSHVEPHA
jgi:hypothetical protein